MEHDYKIIVKFDEKPVQHFPAHLVRKPRGLLVSDMQKQALWLWLNPKIHVVTSVEAVHVQWLLYQYLYL